MVKEEEKKLLKILEEDGRIPVSEIASMIGSDAKKVEKKISELKKSKVIRKFKTSIDWKKAGEPRTAAIIQVKVVPQQRAGFSKACTEISADSRVKDLYVVTGEYDVIMFVEASSIDEISEFVTEKLAPKKGVVGTYTHIVLRDYKRDGVLTFDEGEKRLKISM